MTADDAVAQLVADPVAFLEFNALTIGGGATLDSGKRIFNLCLLSKTAKFSVQGKDWSRVATVRWWRAQVTRDDPQRALKSYKKGDDYYAEVLAYYVAMKQVGEALTTTHFALPGAGGPDLMLTSQLTGCTFGHGSQTKGGSCLASHLQPAPAPGGTRVPDATRKQQMRQAVEGPLGPGASILETSNATQITVVAKRDKGTWVFHKQVIDPLTAQLTTRAATF